MNVKEFDIFFHWSADHLRPNSIQNCEFCFFGPKC